MTRDELTAELAALERYLANRVTLVRVIVDEHGQPTGKRIASGSFSMPPDWEPPSFDELMKAPKGRRD